MSAKEHCSPSLLMKCADQSRSAPFWKSITAATNAVFLLANGVSIAYFVLKHKPNWGTNHQSHWLSLFLKQKTEKLHRSRNRWSFAKICKFQTKFRKTWKTWICFKIKFKLNRTTLTKPTKAKKRIEMLKNFSTGITADLGIRWKKEWNWCYLNYVATNNSHLAETILLHLKLQSFVAAW